MNTTKKLLTTSLLVSAVMTLSIISPAQIMTHPSSGDLVKQQQENLKNMVQESRDSLERIKTNEEEVTCKNLPNTYLIPFPKINSTFF